MAKKHNRRLGYGKAYGKATPQEKQLIIDNAIKAVKNNPPPGVDPVIVMAISSAYSVSVFHYILYVL